MALVEPDGRGWYLAATNGYSELACTCVSKTPSESIYNARVTYRLPGRPELSADLAFPAIPLSYERMSYLHHCVRTFVDRPLGELRVGDFVLTADLASAPGDSFVVSFGPRSDVISGSNGIGCSVEVSRGACSARLVFSTDVTCLELLADGLRSALNASES